MKYKRWIQTEEKLLVEMAAHYYDLKVISMSLSNRWVHLYVQGNKRNMERFDKDFEEKSYCVKKRKPEGCKDIGNFRRKIGTNFEYQVRDAVRQRGWRCERRSGSGAAQGQKGDVVIFDDYGNEIMTLEATKTRGKQITVPEYRLNRISSGESKAIIFALGNSKEMFAIIPWDTDIYPDITFAETLDEFIEAGIEPGGDDSE